MHGNTYNSLIINTINREFFVGGHWRGHFLLDSLFSAKCSFIKVSADLYIIKIIEQLASQISEFGN